MVKRLCLPSAMGTRTAILFFAASALIALVSKLQQNSTLELTAPVTTPKEIGRGHDGTDTFSFIQGRLAVEQDGANTKADRTSVQSRAPDSMSGMTLHSAAPEKAMSSLSINADQGRTLRSVMHRNFSWLGSLLSAKTGHVVTARTASLAVSMAIVICACVLVAVACFVMQSVSPRRKADTDGLQAEISDALTSEGSYPWDVRSSSSAPNLASASQPAWSSPQSNLNSRPTLMSVDAPRSAVPPHSLSHLREPTTQPSPQPQQGLLPVLPPTDHKIVPPALCPNVVLDKCEVRVGVSMYELGQIRSEGELNIVGISGNPLLRAALRTSEAGRSLEISMTDPKSLPRATVGPMPTSHDQQKSRAVQIFGVKGKPYGTLEMRSSGQCYVLKDGQTVLIIDGDNERMHLQIKSGYGYELASATCSSETFGGIEHLEIRVQPGVDTVLVLACVLAVVLLSQYPPSD